LSTHLALGKNTNDLIFSSTGVERVDKGRFVVQQVASKLRVWFGEWSLDPSIGWVNETYFEKNFDLFEIEDRARKIVLATDGVLSITSIESTYKDRKLDISIIATTNYGEISLTVPWEDK